jgi:hypothetical protein
MTVEEVKQRVAALMDDDHRGDAERQHGDEDKLHQDVLRAIASGTQPHNAAELAAEALKSLELTFERWCA